MRRPIRIVAPTVVTPVVVVPRLTEVEVEDLEEDEALGFAPFMTTQFVPVSGFQSVSVFETPLAFSQPVNTFEPVSFFEPASLFSPLSLFEPTSSFSPVSIFQPANVAVSGTILSESGNALQLATANGIVNVFVSPSTALEFSNGFFAGGGSLVPGENVTVVGFPTGGAIEASTIQINSGFTTFGAPAVFAPSLTDLVVSGLVASISPTLGRFMLMSGLQPMPVAVTPATVIEPMGTPVVAIAPSQPVTVIGTVSNGVLIASAVRIED